MTRGFILVTLTVALLSVSPASPVQAKAAALRSGTIVGGAGAGERSGCEYAVECVTWLNSGCEPTLTGLDPVLTASIVDVGTLADGTTHRTLHMEAPFIPPWGVYPGAVIQFWRIDCTEIAYAERHSIRSDSRCAGWPTTGRVWCTFPIPADAKWMTLSAYATTARLSWTLV